MRETSSQVLPLPAQASTTTLVCGSRARERVATLFMYYRDISSDRGESLPRNPQGKSRQPSRDWAWRERRGIDRGNKTLLRLITAINAFPPRFGPYVFDIRGLSTCPYTSVGDENRQPEFLSEVKQPGNSTVPNLRAIGGFQAHRAENMGI